MSRNIWIDTDIALGAASGDVDDAYAIVAVLRALQRSTAGIRLSAISVTSGNTDEASASNCLSLLLRQMGATSIPIVRAAAVPQSMAELPEGTIILALGPLTNLARACRLTPALGQRVELLYVGGVRSRWDWRRRLSDLNMRRDAASAALVLRTFERRRQFPLDVIARLRLDHDRLAQVRATGVLGTFLAQHSQRWLHWAAARHFRRSFPLWDLVAALSAIGLLPGERFDQFGCLQEFNEPLAWQNFVGLLEECN
jgi:inosine-uridine nucleoside N-ribohydrolase